MPALDVSDAFDPDFLETVTVIRRPIVMVKGRATVPAPQTIPDVVAVVNMKDRSLQRDGDQENMPNTISIHTLNFALQGPAPGFEPDYVLWNGDNYVVTKLDDYSRYGSGFTHADCDSVSSIDAAP